MTRSQQARADALADAETLLAVHDAYVGLSDCALTYVKTPWPGFECCDLIRCVAWGDVIRFQAGMHRDLDEYAIEAITAAFKAVPGLRGE